MCKTCRNKEKERYPDFEKNMDSFDLQTLAINMVMEKYDGLNELPPLIKSLFVQNLINCHSLALAIIGELEDRLAEKTKTENEILSKMTN